MRGDALQVVHAHFAELHRARSRSPGADRRQSPPGWELHRSGRPPVAAGERRRLALHSGVKLEVHEHPHGPAQIQIQLGADLAAHAVDGLARVADTAADLLKVSGGGGPA